MISQLAMEAEIRGMRIGELVAAVILEIVKKDLFRLINDDARSALEGAEGSPPSAANDPSAQRAQSSAIEVPAFSAKPLLRDEISLVTSRAQIGGRSYLSRCPIVLTPGIFRRSHKGRGQTRQEGDVRFGRWVLITVIEGVGQ